MILDIKDFLLENNICIENSYLDKYIQLINCNLNRTYQKGKTQSHHIIPRYYYKSVGKKLDNTRSNRVNLLYKDHVLAHYYLFLCSPDNSLYKKGNACAIFKIFGHFNFPKSEQQCLDKLPDFQAYYEQSRSILSEFNSMKNEIHKSYHDKVMQTEEVRSKISNTMKEHIRNGEFFSEEHRKKISESSKGFKFFHRGESELIKVKPEEVDIDKLISEGWIKGNFPRKKELVKITAESHYKKVFCIDKNSNFIKEFNSLKDACDWWVNSDYWIRKKPKNTYQLANNIKKSADKDIFVDDIIKWIYKKEGDLN